MPVGPAQIIGSYVLERRLGSGGMGDVWRAAHADGRHVALKFLHTPNPVLVARLSREGTLQRGIDSPNIVDVFELMEHEGAPVLVMEYIRGPTLGRWLRGRKAEIDEIEVIASGLFDGLEAAHRHGVIHRDLKPNNILLQGLTPKITDFGIARPLLPADLDEALTQTGIPIGTPGFMAPEQIVDSTRVDQRADLFSLGAVLYVLCTGKRAFRGQNRFETLSHTVHARYEQPDRVRPELPAKMCAAITRCLIPDPAERVGSVEAVRALWAGAVNPSIADLPTLVRQGLPSGPALPRLAGPTLGRERDLMRVAGMLRAGSLVTILGPGGMGKTRLSLEVAHTAPDSRRAWFCDLSDVQTTEALCVVVAKSIGAVLRDQDPIGQLGGAMAGLGGAIIVLDNAEQAVEIVASAASAWMHRAPEIRLLVTSRRPLQLLGEQVYTLEPLSTEDAVLLFEQRARRVAHRFAVTDENRAEVAQLVEALDCLPLAVELAAARIRVLGPAEMSERLDDRFQLLRGGRREGPARHSSLKAAIDWSWALLEPWAKLALAQCSVFRGGLTVDAAEAILDLSEVEGAPWPMDAIHALVDHSLLRVRRSGGGSRIALYESIREHAAARLAEQGDVAVQRARRRHAEHYATLGSDAYRKSLRARGGVRRSRALWEEAENLEAAIEAGLQNGWHAIAVDCAMAMAEVFELRGPFLVGAALLQRVGRTRPTAKIDARRGALLSLAGRTEDAFEATTKALEVAMKAADPQLECQVLTDLAALAIHQGRCDDARAHSTRALALAEAHDFHVLAAVALRQLSIVAYDLGESTQAMEYMSRSLVRSVDAGDQRGEASTLHALGSQLRAGGRLGEARQHLEMALAIQRQVGDRREEGAVLGSLGMTCRLEGKLRESQRYFERAMVIHLEVGDRRRQASVLSYLGNNKLSLGQVGEARGLYEKALAIHRLNGDKRGAAILLANLGGLHFDRGDSERALALYDEALVVQRELESPRGIVWLLDQMGLVHRFAGRLERAAALHLEAVAMTRSLVFPGQLGIALGNLGDLQLEMGDLEAAELHLRESIAIGGDANAIIAGSFRGSLALIAARRGQFDDARSLLDHAEGLLDGLNAVEFGKLLTKRGHVEHLAGNAEAARSALDRAEAIALEIGAADASEIGRAVRDLREVL